MPRGRNAHTLFGALAPAQQSPEANVNVVRATGSLLMLCCFTSFFDAFATSPWSFHPSLTRDRSSLKKKPCLKTRL
ncbi:hypothetical protein QR680_000797 [Steinernema hermaphroditum]|uniref:Uncharacterized protein n=1 Tax=Steinernema hermaphroditum TaxID=289476 RepID=A0AA39GVX1_9BILA|nr:hypothetical protein QR680_000797 [Steinernema hermaphroditum]